MLLMKVKTILLEPLADPHGTSCSFGGSYFDFLCLGGGKYEGPVGAGDQEVTFLFFAPSLGIHSDSGKKD